MISFDGVGGGGGGGNIRTVSLNKVARGITVSYVIIPDRNAYLRIHGSVYARMRYAQIDRKRRWK